MGFRAARYAVTAFVDKAGFAVAFRLDFGVAYFTLRYDVLDGGGCAATAECHVIFVTAATVGMRTEFDGDGGVVTQESH